jgi:hypothetical protein
MNHVRHVLFIPLITTMVKKRVIVKHLISEQMEIPHVISVEMATIQMKGKLFALGVSVLAHVPIILTCQLLSIKIHLYL